MDAGKPMLALVKYHPWRAVTGNQFSGGHFVVIVGDVQPVGYNRWHVHFDAVDGTEYRMHVHTESSSFTVYESTGNAEPNAVTQYVVEG